MRGGIEVARHGDPVAAVEQREFFVAQGIGAGEVFEVGFAEVGEDTDVGADAVGESWHFAGVADAGFDDAPFMVRRQFREGEGNADLAVVAAWTAKRDGARSDQLQQPFLDGGFAVAPRDGDDGRSACVAPLPGERLPSGDGIGAPDDIGFRKAGWLHGVADQEVTSAVGMGFFEECVAVVPIAREGHKCSGSGFGSFKRPGILGDEQGGARWHGRTGRGYGVYS